MVWKIPWYPNLSKKWFQNQWNLTKNHVQNGPKRISTFFGSIFYDVFISEKMILQIRRRMSFHYIVTILTSIVKIIYILWFNLSHCNLLCHACNNSNLKLCSKGLYFNTSFFILVGGFFICQQYRCCGYVLWPS